MIVQLTVSMLNPEDGDSTLGQNVNIKLRVYIAPEQTKIFTKFSPRDGL